MNLRTILGHFVTLSVGHGASKGIAFFTTLVLARVLAPSDLALFAILMTGLGYMLAVTNWGSDAIGIRTTANESDAARANASAVARFRLLVGAGVGLATIAAGLYFRLPPRCLLPLTLCTVALAFRQDWLLLGSGRTKSVGIALAGREIGFLAVVLLVVARWPRIEVVLWGVFAAELLWTFLTRWLARRDVVAGTASGSLSPGSLAAHGLPIVIVSVTMLTNNKIDLPILARFRPDLEVASYWAAYNVLFAGMAFAALLTRAALPEMARQARISHESGSAGTFRFAVLSGVAGCVVALAIWAGADVVVRLLYGDRLAGGAAPLKILALALPVHFFGAVLVGRLVAERRQHLWTVASVLAAAVNLGLNLHFIPRYGAPGAAWATVASESVIGFSALVAFRKHSLHRALVLNAGWIAACFALEMVLIVRLGSALGLGGVLLGTALLGAFLLLPALQWVPGRMRLSQPVGGGA